MEFSTIQNVVDYSQNKLISLDKILDVYKIGYEIDIIDNVLTQEDTNNVINFYLISPQFPFPVSGILYSPVHVVEPFKEYEFELISFVSSNVIEEDDNLVEETDNLVTNDVIDESVDENIIDSVIEEDIVIADTVKENVIVDDIIDYDSVMVDDTTDKIIPDVDENVVIEKLIEENISNIEIVENVDESKNNDTTDNKSSVTNLVGLVLLLVTVGGFVYYKKFKNNSLKSNNDSKSDSIIKTVHFDDKVTINIKKKEQQ